MKKKLTKYDFFSINRGLNQNYNSKSFFGFHVKSITHGEEMKLNYFERKRKTGGKK